MAITSHDIFATIIPLMLQGDGPQRAYIAYAAIRAVIESREHQEAHPSGLVDAMDELWLLFHDLDGWEGAKNAAPSIKNITPTMHRILESSGRNERQHIVGMAMRAVLETYPAEERYRVLDDVMQMFRRWLPEWDC